MCYYQVKPDGLWPGADPSSAWNSAKSNTVKVTNSNCSIMTDVLAGYLWFLEIFFLYFFRKEPFMIIICGISLCLSITLHYLPSVACANDQFDSWHNKQTIIRFVCGSLPGLLVVNIFTPCPLLSLYGIIYVIWFLVYQIPTNCTLLGHGKCYCCWSHFLFMHHGI